MGIFGLLGGRQACAAVLVVDSLADTTVTDGSCTLREAILNANTNTDTTSGDCPPGSATEEDVIQLPAGTITLSILGTGEDAGLIGDLDLADMAGLHIVGSGSETTIVDAAGIDRVFDIHQGNATFTGLTIMGGNTVSATPENGAGISFHSDYMTLTLQEAVVRSNHGQNGGGVSLTTFMGCTGLFLKTHILDNRADVSGGGLYVGETNIVVGATDTVVARNVAVGNGGGICETSLYASLGLHRCEIRDNSAENGGGVCAIGVDPSGTISSSSIADNTAENQGGGFFFDPSFVEIGSFFLRNTTISSNRSKGDGGGICCPAPNYPALLTMNNVTIANNTADSDTNGTGNGGGFFVAGNGVFNVANTIVGSNFDGGGETPDVDANSASGAGVVSFGHNLVGNSFGTGWPPTFSDILDEDPLLGPLDYHNGPTRCHSLLVGSPAIDNATSVIGTFPSCEPDDQRGFARPADGDIDSNPIGDIGAFEFQVTDIEINKTISADPVVAGATFTYRLDVFNNGPIQAFNDIRERSPSRLGSLGSAFDQHFSGNLQRNSRATSTGRLVHFQSVPVPPHPS